ncbi:hypothetical protein [Acidihalobacter prosperus]|uniref:hypothetical protein n=1 Tax=Acidihalobacter prosperus TaxID=160660 RepID=UPI0011AB2E1C|nr:hypothetical protein [Acidihalobacter prosperus]
MIAAGVVRHLVKKEKVLGFSESFYLDRMVANRRIGGRNISVNFLLDARMKQYTIKTPAFEVKCIRGMIKKITGHPMIRGMAGLSGRAFCLVCEASSCR